jgi:hypothetical protein
MRLQKKYLLAVLVLLTLAVSAIVLIIQNKAQNIDPAVPKAKVDFNSYEDLVSEVKEFRQDKLVNLDEFLKMSKEENVIILDTRSDGMYNSKHIKGAIHLNFSDFTQANLSEIIPDPDTKILIYCNNNFDDDPVYFATKSAMPNLINTTVEEEITLALNIPTYINLYGYGYRNIYELSEFVSIYDSRIEFEGDAIDVN